MTIKENNTEHVCYYGHRFKAKDVKLVPFKNDSKELLGCVIFVKTDEDKQFKGGRPTDGYLVACPVCGIVQLGGFICPGDADKLQNKSSATITRNIVLSL